MMDEFVKKTVDYVVIILIGLCAIKIIWAVNLFDFQIRKSSKKANLM